MQALSRQARACALVLGSLFAAGSSLAATVAGELFDVSYDDTGFPAGSGFSLVAPDTVRFTLRGDGDITVGPTPDSIETDSASDSLGFTLLPKAGITVSGVQMFVTGSFDNPTESATLTYSESLAAAGASDGDAVSLGVFTSGALPSGSEVSFAGTTLPVAVSFSYLLNGFSSDPFVASTASLAYIDFRVAAVPEPETYALLLAGLGLTAAVARRRKAG
ncbi:PEP-CTERM sorting domain-containing protein [Caldimonas brevitalea]|uniref:Ice-binding protein C-terminal domain-containing protein n=1 Tax=Caldimonas brevitalea TaxID=413882 RepID=A0A0G3BRZ0_9BURK|nr:PEP-CTERM sorting domain-containing protein [Caldimonas brevitalea]AKJ32199.1 hypothetical protein AAW51_5508 [Caldimonas brevitalea]